MATTEAQQPGASSSLWWSVMQCFLVFIIACLGFSWAAHTDLHKKDAVSRPSRPQIYYCRSPNMETFTCWWHPVENTSSNEMVNYTFTYTIENEHVPRQCPDYVTGGPNSCYFDMAHTRLWKVYCMNVTARTSRGIFTSQEHCLDVADIVEIDPPFNLRYALMNNREGESRQTAQVSWSYPIPSHVYTGWLTLVYELRFRTITHPGNWKVKGLLREPRLKLDLSGGSYEVMVRCRSQNNNIWSQWSAPLIINVPHLTSTDIKSAIKDAVSRPSRPQIYYCRSPNMETFTCWWHPVENTSSNEMVNYTFTYTIENEHVPRQCPDYVTGGPNSCYFDMAHTHVQEVYCMNVTARTSRGIFTSQEHCLDVADIVEIDPPFNLTYALMNNREEASGHTAQVSWSYPIPSHVHTGWITLVYELRFRTITHPGNWKVKGLLREPQLKLDLSGGSYEVMVRCRTKNNNIWSQWSAPLIINVPHLTSTDIKSAIKDAVSRPSRPQIYYCRSPNMETFTCWWHPVENTSSNEMVNYTFTYTIEDEHVPRQCPDYVTGGPNSCYFDMAHTRVWEVYCMNVTARTSQGIFTSQEHCLDVADIVEIDPPFNLTYTLMNNTEGESGRTANVSWSYPIPSHVHIGWITLVYELRFRTLTDPGNWKVKGLLREPQLELLDLPGGSYEVMVRCRSQNNNIWSQWSAPLIINVPSRHTGANRMLALILITVVGVMAFLIIGFGVIPQNKRIKAFLLPPIPKPRIRGLDPVLLKKGQMDEINRHFSSFHGYKSPQYHEETWYQVYTDETSSLPCNIQSQPISEKTVPTVPRSEQPAYAQNQQITLTSEQSPNSHAPTPYTQNPASYVTESMAVPTFPPPALVSPWAASFGSSPNPQDFGSSHPQQISFPSMGYSLIVNAAPVGAMPVTSMPGMPSMPAMPAMHDFYTCVNVVSPSGAVQLVPCLPEVSKSRASMQQLGDEDSLKNSQMSEYMGTKVEESISGSACLNHGEVGGKQDGGTELAAELLSQQK